MEPKTVPEMAFLQGFVNEISSGFVSIALQRLDFDNKPRAHRCENALKIEVT